MKLKSSEIGYKPRRNIDLVRYIKKSREYFPNQDDVSEIRKWISKLTDSELKAQLYLTSYLQESYRKSIPEDTEEWLNYWYYSYYRSLRQDNITFCPSIFEVLDSPDASRAGLDVLEAYTSYDKHGNPSYLMAFCPKCNCFHRHSLEEGFRRAHKPFHLNWVEDIPNPHTLGCYYLRPNGLPIYPEIVTEVVGLAHSLSTIGKECPSLYHVYSLNYLGINGPYIKLCDNEERYKVLDFNQTITRRTYSTLRRKFDSPSQVYPYYRHRPEYDPVLGG